MAATLAKSCVGQRSGVSPVRASVVSQNQSNVRSCSVSRNASWAGSVVGRRLRRARGGERREREERQGGAHGQSRGFAR